MAILLFADVFTAIKDAIIRRNAAISPQQGSVVTDAVITPLALEIVKQSVRSDAVSRFQSVDLVLQLLNDDELLALLAASNNSSVDDTIDEVRSALESYAANFNLTRKAPTNATGFVQYGVAATPVSDITVLLGSIVQTAGGVQYAVTQTVTLIAANAPDYFDATTGLYLLQAPVTAILAGSTGNATTNTVNQIVTPVSGFTSVNNSSAISNGTDEETDEDFVARIKLIFPANNIGTRDGYERLILENTTITDVFVVDANDVLSVRNQIGGEVDVYILDRNIVQFVETFNTVVNPQVLTKQPVSALVSLSSGTGTLVKDTSNLAGSIRAQDNVSFTVLPTPPYSVTYTYDKNVEDTQALIDQDQYFILGSDPLIKQATQIDADIIFSYVVLPNFSKQIVTPTIITALGTLVAALKLGEDLDQGDVIAAIQSVSGVDRVVLPLTKFNKSTLTGVVDVIEANDTEFIRLGTLTIS